MGKTREGFSCPRMKQRVTITLEGLSHQDSMGDEESTEDYFPVDCDHKKLCGVGTPHSQGVSYDWSKCMHPGLRKSEA